MDTSYFTLKNMLWHLLGVALMLWLFLGVMASCDVLPARAETTADIQWSVDQIANAIYIAEGGTHTAHPYGILAHYKHTTPRQACINTINHALRDWNGRGDFIRFLQRRYCPIGAANDPQGLNKNWYKNVMHYLKGGK